MRTMPPITIFYSKGRDIRTMTIQELIQELMQKLYEAIEPGINQIIDILEQNAKANDMTLDEFLEALQKQVSIDSQIQAMDEQKFLLDDDTAKWN